jgi:hypothetical protein
MSLIFSKAFDVILLLGGIWLAVFCVTFLLNFKEFKQESEGADPTGLRYLGFVLGSCLLGLIILNNI